MWWDGLSLKCSLSLFRLGRFVRREQATQRLEPPRLNAGIHVHSGKGELARQQASIREIVPTACLSLTSIQATLPIQRDSARAPFARWPCTAR